MNNQARMTRGTSRLRRSLFVFSVVIGMIGSLSGAAAASDAGFVYALQNVNGGPNQIYGFHIDSTGALVPVPGFPVPTGGTGSTGTGAEQLTISNDRLYVINDGDDTLSAFAVNRSTGALTALPYSPIALGTGLWTCVAVHPTGSPVIVGDAVQYVVSLNVTPTAVTAAAGSPYVAPAHPFSCAFSHDGQYFYGGGAADSNISGFSVDAGSGVLTALAGSPFPSGGNFPIAYATDAAGRLFAASYSGGQVRAFTTDGGVPTAVTSGAILSGLSQATDGLIHPAGFYMVADRIGNRVGVYRVTGSGAATTLTPATFSPFSSGGLYTDAIALTSDGGLLIAANGDTRNLTVFHVDTSTGGLTGQAIQPANSLGTSGRITGLAIVAAFIPSAAPGDFNGDAKADLGVVAPGSGTWTVAGQPSVQWGIAGDMVVAADYAGSGKSQVAVWRPSTGFWYVKDGVSAQWGQAGDIPVPADYTGDGVADLAVFRPATGTWLIKGLGAIGWGQPGDIPVPGDYDGDGTADVAIWRPSTGYWFVRGSTGATMVIEWGRAGDIPVPADYTGDRRTDIAVYRPSSIGGGPWWYVRGVGSWALGAVGDLPVPQDLNGDGQAELVVYRPSTGDYLSFSWATATHQTTTVAAGQIPVVLPVALRYSAALRNSVAGDVDGDRRRDATIYRPSGGDWWTIKSGGGYQHLAWGGPAEDVPVPGDYDGDGAMDAAIYRPSTGTWWLLFSSSGYTMYRPVVLGLSTDIPVIGDFDGDGRTDVTVFRPSDASWRSRLSTTGYASTRTWSWGVAGSTPIAGDFDGDGITDVTVSLGDGSWWALLSSTGYTTYRTWTVGAAGDQPVPGDFDGDGVTDVAKWRPSTGTWNVLLSSTGFTMLQSWTWGIAGDVPIVGDFDGDGKADITVYRPSNSAWYSLFSGSGYSFAYWLWGVSTDIVTPTR